MCLIFYRANKGKKNLLRAIFSLATFGITKDDSKKKPAGLKIYDFTKMEIVDDQRMEVFV